MRSFIIVFLLVLNISAFAQESVITPQTDYLKKSRNEKILAWSLLIGGNTLMFISVKTAFDQPWFTFGDTPKVDNSASNTLGIIGLTAALASVPVFIVAHKHKMKSLHVSVVDQPIDFPIKNNIPKKQPALKLTIAL